MAARQPVSINGVTFDALIEATRTLEADAPFYPVETGFEVSDSIILRPQSLSMVLYVTNTPVTWISRHGASHSRVQDVITQLEALYFAREPVTIRTSEATYENMAILTIELTKSRETGTSREIPITFQEIRVTESRTAAIPDSYGRGGNTGHNAGVASTTQSPTPQGRDLGNDGSRGSILYGLAGATGLLGVLQS